MNTEKVLEDLIKQFVTLRNLAEAIRRSSTPEMIDSCLMEVRGVQEQPPGGCGRTLGNVDQHLSSDVSIERVHKEAEEQIKTLEHLLNRFAALRRAELSRLGRP